VSTMPDPLQSRSSLGVVPSIDSKCDGALL
jgi:hypothetical protein